MSTKPPALPSDLSATAAQLWTELVEANRFERHELAILHRALTWFDVSDNCLQQSTTATGQEQSALVRRAADASTTALRHWWTLKWSNGEPARRPGRQPDDRWNAQRRAQAGLR